MNEINPGAGLPALRADQIERPTSRQRERPTSRGRFWAFDYREARAHAFIVATILWSLAAVLILGGSGYRSFTGRLKGTDFVQFYTLGHLALSGDVGRLYDFHGLHKKQEDLVPASAPEWYPPVYPPQVALMFAPLAHWSYGTAAILWGLVTVALYAAVVRIAWHPSRTLLPDGHFVAAAAAAFPPFWNLVLHGQTTVVPLLAFCLGWLALERQHRFLAGIAFGLLAFKPQYGIVLAAVVLARREWALLGGAIVSVAGQVAAVCLALDASAVWIYLRILPQLPEVRLLDLHKMHSLRALTGLLPSPLGTLAWSLASVGITWQTVRMWRTDVPVTVRMAVLVLASVLVSPHAGIYDATLLALPLLWVAGWIRAHRQAHLGSTFWPTVYWLFVAFFVPTAIVLRVQASVLLMVFMFVQVTRQFTPSQDVPV